MTALSDKKFVEDYEDYVDFDNLGKKALLIIWVLSIFLFAGGIAVFVSNITSGDSQDSEFSIFSTATFLVSSYLMWKSRKKRNEYLAQIGMDEKQAKQRYDSIVQCKLSLFYIPWVQKLCMLNPDAKHSQEEFLDDWYGMNNSSASSFVFDYVYDEKSWDSTSRYFKCSSLTERRLFVEKMFKLAIMEDGIRNDEWQLLMNLMTELRFNKYYAEYFIKRFGPLRTEFDEEERKKFAEEAAPSVSQINSYYAVLGLNEGATDDEIKKAYHALALQHHPDLPKNAERIQECEEMMAKINEAYNKIIKI